MAIRGASAPQWWTQACRDLAVQLQPARRHEVVPQHRLVEPVGEAVPRRQRAVGQRLLPALDDEPAHATEAPQVLLHPSPVAAHEVGDHRAQELAPGDARHLQDLPLLPGQPLQLLPHQVLQALGGLEVQLLDRAGERPAPVAADDVLPLHEDVHQAPHEERQPLGARVERAGESGRKAVPREAALEVGDELVLA